MSIPLPPLPALEIAAAFPGMATPSLHCLKLSETVSSSEDENVCLLTVGDAGHLLNGNLENIYLDAR